ncbi:MAG: type I toxin-antitoxin system SymE family toxin [Firmicutes bacterium]|nr:type I toxin-antitoxin system SymE family toxin [Bacillota bacterium]
MKRKLKVYEMSGATFRGIPSIRLQGKWLEKLGYQPGQAITVREDGDRLVIEKSSEEKANE